MTSTTVNSAQALFMNLTAGNVKGNENGMNFQEGSFSDVLGKQTGTKEEPVVTKSVKMTKDSTHIQDKVKNVDTKQPESVEEGDVEVNEVVTEKLEKAGEEVVKELAEELGVTEEEIIAVMEQLGLSFGQMLQPENLAEVILQISGETDMLALTTDENLYQIYKDICEVAVQNVEAVAEEFGITKEQLVQVVLEQSNVESVPEEDLTHNTPRMQIEVSVDEEVVTVTANDEADTKQSVVKETATDAPEAKETFQEVAQTKPSNNEGNASKQDKGSDADMMGQGERTQQGFVTRNNFLGTNPFAEQLQQVEMPNVQQSYFSPQTQNIMNQIMDFMKVQVHTEMTEVQLQLQPETLGTLNVHVSAKEGVITAQFAAESENVKAVLESQIIQLKETFAEQGLKVEAIEITLASHEFERNLEQGRERDEAPQEGKKKRKNMNLSEIGSVELDELEDADRINAQMMEQNGNTVDYSA